GIAVLIRVGSIGGGNGSAPPDVFLGVGGGIGCAQGTAVGRLVGVKHFFSFRCKRRNVFPVSAVATVRACATACESFGAGAASPNSGEVMGIELLIGRLNSRKRAGTGRARSRVGRAWLIILRPRGDRREESQTSDHQTHRRDLCVEPSDVH